MRSRLAAKQGLITIAELAKRLELHPMTFWTWVSSGEVEAPSVQLGRRIYYSAEQAKRVEFELRFHKPHTLEKLAR